MSADCTLYLGYNPGSSGTYNLGGSGLLSAPNEYLGYSGSGSFTQSGGTNSVPAGGSLALGSGTGSSGTYNLSGSGQLSASYESIGYSGTGNFIQTGGTHTVSGNGGLDLGVRARREWNVQPERQWRAFRRVNERLRVHWLFRNRQLHAVGRSPCDYRHRRGLYVGYSSGAAGTYNLMGAACSLHGVRISAITEPGSSRVGRNQFDTGRYHPRLRDWSGPW